MTAPDTPTLRSAPLDREELPRDIVDALGSWASALVAYNRSSHPTEDPELGLACSRSYTAVRDAIIARFAQSGQGVVVPDGWKLVPIVPTPEMLDAGEETSVSNHTGTPIVTPGGVWDAMLAAAPVLSEVPDEKLAELRALSEKADPNPFRVLVSGDDEVMAAANSAFLVAALKYVRDQIATTSSVSDDWQPIGTAPHGKKVLLGWYESNGEWNEVIGRATWHWGNNVANDICHHSRATHWRPLPAPPTSEPSR